MTNLSKQSRSDSPALRKLSSQIKKNRQRRNLLKAFGGATGGIRFLISRNAFKEKQGLAEVRTALSDEGYHYSRQAVHIALNNLASKGGPLVSLQEGGRKVYVERK